MRLAAYPQEMAKRVQGQDRQNAKLASMLRAKAFNWSHQIVFTQIGTSGNGKTEYAFSMAEVLFGSRDAAFKIPGLTNWGDLNNYLRSDTGFSGHREVTDFERWFMARKTLGGGVIILDELLSFSGLKAEEISAKVGVINKLYDLLDEGVLKFGNRKEDARGFVVAITGNSMQELFDAIDDSPESEKLVQRILARIDGNDITKYFARIGIDAPKVARFGPIFVNGPLPRAVSERVGQKEVRNAIARATEEIRQIYDVEVIIDPKIIGEIVSTVTTVRLGMRDVNQAIKTLIIGPVSGIFFNLVGSEKIEATWLDGKIVWTVDGQRVVSTVTGAADAIDHVWSVEKDLESNAVVSTPQMKDVTHPPKIIMTPAERLRVAHHEVLGHFMTAYLLSGKNNTETISLVPTDGMLGMVRLKESRFEYDGESLTSWLKEMAVLESGHRAVFISGYYSAGGGSGERRDPRKPAMDDLGRVQSVLDTMLSNQIFNHFTEFSSSADRDLFKKFMMHVTKGIADRIIRYGIKSRAFEELFNETYASKFIAAERIELLIAQADTSKLLKPDELLSRATASASAQALIKMRASHIVSERDLKRVGDLARELVTKVNRELGMGEAGRRLGVSKVKPSVNTCESIFKAAF